MTIAHQTIEVVLTIDKSGAAAPLLSRPTLPELIIDGAKNETHEEQQSTTSLDRNLEEEDLMLGLTASQDPQVDKVYTIGCFDLFHQGHIILLKRMRTLGKKVIVGVHDSESIYKLKKRVPIDSTEKRMLNVKQYADEVFCVPSCDPSTFMACIYDASSGENALYVRGDDMIDFPARKLVEELMPIKFLPYTKGVSSTQIRKEKYSDIASDDELYLQCNP